MKQKSHDNNEIDVLIEEKKKKKLTNELKRIEKKDVSTNFLSFVEKKKLKKKTNKLKKTKKKRDKKIRRMYQQTF